MFGLLFWLLRLIFRGPSRKRTLRSPQPAPQPVYVLVSDPNDPRLAAQQGLTAQAPVPPPTPKRPPVLRRALGPGGAALAVGLLLTVGIGAACSRVLDETEPVRRLPETLVTIVDALPSADDLPGVDTVAYVRRVVDVAGRASRLVADSHSLNREWDNRAETGATSAETRSSFDELDRRAQDLRAEVEALDVPQVPGLGTLHTSLVGAVTRMADAATEGAAGFRSPDTGERRRAALDELVSAFGDLNGFVSRIGGLLENEPTEPDQPAPPSPAPEPGTQIPVADLLAALPIEAENRGGYDRELFDHWSDLDSDGCDTRREVLIRDATEVVMATDRECWIESGRWYSVYDDQWVTEPGSLDIDHVVPLAEAWDSGAASWDSEQREAFANDEAALLAVTARSNRAKGADDPTDWLPSNPDYLCQYTALWIVTKTRWGLSIDTAELATLEQLVGGPCDGLAVVHTPTGG